MPDAPKEILLVTPVWNDSARLAVFGKDLANALAASRLPIRWMIADDGSGDGEHARLKELHGDFSKVFDGVGLHFAARHAGKGAVVREAWSLAPDAEWLAFVDADGSVSAEDMLDLINRAVTTGVSVLAIRKRTATTHIEESLIRGLAHRGFLLAARAILGFHCEDPQCGAKVIKGDDYRAIAGKLIEEGFAFDSELLAALNHHGAPWAEVPVTWIQKKGAKVKLWRDAWRMFAALLRIRAMRTGW
jgi:glycosyltransferase involved in cell wall biosynthesis